MLQVYLWTKISCLPEWGCLCPRIISPVVLTKVTLCQVCPSSCAHLMLSSLPQGCAKAGGSMCMSSPQVESHSDVSMSQTRGSLSPKLGLPLGKSRHLPLCNPEQVPFSRPGRYPFLAYRNVRELACLKVSVGTSTEGSTAGLVLQSTCGILSVHPRPDLPKVISLGLCTQSTLSLPEERDLPVF